eukprot:CAMPEP_0181380576 /NCGR_PEP_ID=MMETSP1106-20121128/19626_1 /TAXON_ID=81844 /ORGANISM="Mantoniella antarctica, Strain SL-175" /LENGTH=38 /DNA_ID= /DNA_START= /DNA_END= /DNA_ORIENTATION=
MTRRRLSEGPSVTTTPRESLRPDPRAVLRSISAALAHS